MARVLGFEVSGFEKMAKSLAFFDPNAAPWWGKCHAWTWMSLSAFVNSAVDLLGFNQSKGAWFLGQWISKADLGNWSMGVADKISLNDTNELYCNEVNADKLLAACVRFLNNDGGGFIANIWNPQKRGKREVWNQPFCRADFDSRTLTGNAASTMLAFAAIEGLAGATTVKHLNITGYYGVEASDDWEGESRQNQKNWTMYCVCGADGKVLKSYMADDPKLAKFNGLPTRHSSEIPEYIWRPSHQPLKDVLAGRANPTVDNDKYGPEFKFFVGKLLQHRVPNEVRAEFERAVLANPGMGTAEINALADKLPGVANAYSPQAWQAHFQARGFDAKRFGAVWAS
jgi:hypothetical protein